MPSSHFSILTRNRQNYGGFHGFQMQFLLPNFSRHISSAALTVVSQWPPFLHPFLLLPGNCFSFVENEILEIDYGIEKTKQTILIVFSSESGLRNLFLSIVSRKVTFLRND